MIFFFFGFVFEDCVEWLFWITCSTGREQAWTSWFVEGDSCSCCFLETLCRSKALETEWYWSIINFKQSNDCNIFLVWGKDLYGSIFSQLAMVAFWHTCLKFYIIYLCWLNYVCYTLLFHDKCRGDKWLHSGQCKWWHKPAESGCKDLSWSFASLNSNGFFLSKVVKSSLNFFNGDFCNSLSFMLESGNWTFMIHPQRILYLNSYIQPYKFCWWAI